MRGMTISGRLLCIHVLFNAAHGEFGFFLNFSSLLVIVHVNSTYRSSSFLLILPLFLSSYPSLHLKSIPALLSSQSTWASVVNQTIHAANGRKIRFLSIPLELCGQS